MNFVNIHSGETPLHIAVQFGVILFRKSDIEIILLLVERGANPMALTNKGNCLFDKGSNCLHLAAQSGFKAGVFYFLSLGLVINLKIYTHISIRATSFPGVPFSIAERQLPFSYINQCMCVYALKNVEIVNQIKV